MANLKCKTRGNTNPQGKPRVYFCCHPEDFERYFEAVSEEILAKHNCAIWYMDNRSSEQDEIFLEYLKEMQLFVMPVTTNLLCTKNAALDSEFKLAIRNHIPVLPLMQESGLDELFNQKCGELQYLDKHNTDTTAISYEEKLEKYLSSVLIGDELAQKIRNAFDAYVFLSYRKKDRKYAQELMRLIHKNEFCRDIAIWYDEFLTPGENFNDSIKEALQKSSLFVLTVTPNLVNETNYIMTTEYPMAKQEGKPILPAELVSTDKEQLSEKYEDIPACADAHNEAELSEALLGAIKKMAIQENDTSPEHNFFIGLAYLGGVDVEVDYERALSLITSASEDGLCEATRKLVSMYRFGKGVERNFAKAIALQKKLIDQCEKIFAETKSENDCIVLLDALVECGEFYLDSGKLEDARQAFMKAKHIVDDYGLASPTIRYGLSVCSTNLGHIFREMGNLECALDHYYNALEITQMLVLESDSDNYKQSLCISYCDIGKISRKLLRYEEALEMYDAALKCSQSDDTTGDIHLLIGDIYDELGKEIDALNEYEKARFYFEKASLEDDSVDDKLNVAIAYSRIGRILEASRQFDTALEMYAKAREIQEELVDQTDAIQDKINLTITYQKIAITYATLKMYEKSMGFYQKATEILEGLAQRTDIVKVKRELSAAYNNVAISLMNLGKINEAIEEFKRSLKLREEIVSCDLTIQAKLDLCENYDNLGNIYHMLKRPEEAIDLFDKSMQLAIELSSNHKSPQIKFQLAFSYLNIGYLQKNSEKLQKAYEMFDALSKEYPEVGEYARKRDFARRKLNELAADNKKPLFSKLKNLFKK